MERVALDLALGVREHGVDALVVALGEAGPIRAELRAAGVPVFSLPRRGRGYDFAMMLRLRALFRAEGANVVHTHNPLALLYGAAAGRLAGCGVVHTKHGINPGSTRQLALRRQAGRLVDSFVAVSPATAIVAMEKREVDATRLRVIPNGIDLGRFSEERSVRDETRAQLGIAPGAWVIGTVGRLAPEKDQATLIRAAGSLLGEDCQLLLVGDGEEAGALREVTKTLPNARFVCFAGARSDVPDLLSAMDVFVLSSVTEGMPLAILEAMAAGLPMLCTPVGGVPELVRAAGCGDLFPVADEAALRTLLQALRANPVRARIMGDRGRAFVRATYSRDVAVDRYLAAYAYAGALAARRRTTEWSTA